MEEEKPKRWSGRRPGRKRIDERGDEELEYLPGWLTARQAADRIGYEYKWFIGLLNQGKIKRARRWQRVWVIPDDLTEEEVIWGMNAEGVQEKIDQERTMPWEHDGKNRYG